ncbi:MAG: hypothetical protein QF440_02825 [Candidatus Thalassarchaeaceae archaeon]|jgi:hypothetical protein|nr:hypothetical protein [Candidatus Thalassarchaeaceae archaeon]
MDPNFIIAIGVTIIGISIGVWFISSRLRLKLAEVEERKADQNERN